MVFRYLEPSDPKITSIEDLIDIRDALELFENDFDEKRGHGKETESQPGGDLDHNDLFEAFTVSTSFDDIGAECSCYCLSVNDYSHGLQLLFF